MVILDFQFESEFLRECCVCVFDMSRWDWHSVSMAWMMLGCCVYVL